MEAAIAASRGLDFHPLEASAVTGRGLLGARRGAAGARALDGAARRDWCAGLDARVVVATGGYACVAAAIGAFFARRPVVLVEPNATAGLANRALSRIATAAAVAWPQTARALHCPARETGVPVRREFFAQPTEPPAGTAVATAGARRQPGCRDAQRGGAGGARSVAAGARTRDLGRASGRPRQGGGRRAGRTRRAAIDAAGGAVPRRRPERDGGEPSRPVAGGSGDARGDLRRGTRGGALPARARGGASGREREGARARRRGRGGGGRGRGGGAGGDDRRGCSIRCCSPAWDGRRARWRDRDAAESIADLVDRRRWRGR